MPRTRKPKTTKDEWGSITQTPEGSWRLRHQTPDGKRRNGGRYRTRAEAEDARAKLRTSILGGTWRATGSTESPLLADYCFAWLQRAELAGDLAPSSVALYRAAAAHQPAGRRRVTVDRHHGRALVDLVPLDEGQHWRVPLTVLVGAFVVRQDALTQH